MTYFQIKIFFKDTSVVIINTKQTNEQLFSLVCMCAQTFWRQNNNFGLQRDSAHCYLFVASHSNVGSVLGPSSGPAAKVPGQLQTVAVSF